MPLRLEQKREVVAEINKVALSSVSAVVADYRGLTVSQLTQLRREARNANVYLRVVRNTLTRRAVEETQFVCMQDVLVGPVILAFSADEPGSAARLLRDFMKENEQLKVKALSVGGKLFSEADLETIATLPTRDEAIATLLSVMKAPITKLVQTLAEPCAKLVRTFAAVRDKKG